MPQYRLRFDIKTAHGTQEFIVQAENKQEALLLFYNGKAIFDREEVEVVGLHTKPDIFLDEEE